MFVHELRLRWCNRIPKNYSSTVLYNLSLLARQIIFVDFTICKSSHCDNLIHATSVVGFHSWVRSQWIFLPCSCYSSCQSIFFQPLWRWRPISLLGEIFFHVWAKHCPSYLVTTINIWFLKPLLIWVLLYSAGLH